MQVRVLFLVCVLAALFVGTVTATSQDFDLSEESLASSSTEHFLSLNQLGATDEPETAFAELDETTTAEFDQEENEAEEEFSPEDDSETSLLETESENESERKHHKKTP